MKPIYLSIVSMAALVCVSCAGQSSPNATVSQAEAAPKPDMKAMFGDDYQKGDIGHSKGLVTEINAETGIITIDHGTLHGTSIEAAVSSFETLPSAKNAVIAQKDRVEFLVKKGDDSTYRLLSICAIAQNEDGCL